MKKMILKFSQNLQKNTWGGVTSLIKLQVSGLQLKSPIEYYSGIWENFKNTFCIKHNWVATFECLSSSKYAFLSVAISYK